MRTMLIAFAVLCALGLLGGIGSAQADVVTPPTAELLTVPELTLHEAAPAQRKFVIPKEVEFSTLTGAALPGATGGGCVSYLFAETENGWAQFFADAGLMVVESKPLAVLLGISTSITNEQTAGFASRIGVGGYCLLDEPAAGTSRFGVCLYLRLPIGRTTAF